MHVPTPGLPMVTSRRGGIPEIGGDAALYFRLPDVGELAERLADLIDDPLVRAGGARARARETLLVCHQYSALLAALGEVQR